MYRFAHISDCHLGFQKQGNLQNLEQEIFERILDECIKRKVNFILIAGDLFHVNLPDMHVNRYAFRKFKEVYDAGIPIYVVYGSHDYSPVAHSIIDLLTDVGYLIKTTNVNTEETEKIKLEFLEDPSTKVKIVGLPGRTAGLEKEYYEYLDKESLEKEKGFKIFLFHAGLDEIKTKAEINSMPISHLPRGFDYYAGGHVHTNFIQEREGYGIIAYPGTIFAGYHSDLEDNAKGTKRGFIVVEFDTKIEKVEFVTIKNADYELIENDATGKSANSVNLDLAAKITQIDPKNKIVIIKVWGELLSGKTSEIDFTKFREELKEKGAIDVKINHRNITSKEYVIASVRGENREEIEENIFRENIAALKIDQSELRNGKGIKLSTTLLQQLRIQPLINEKKTDYQQRIEKHALKLLNLELTDDS